MKILDALTDVLTDGRTDVDAGSMGILQAHLVSLKAQVSYKLFTSATEIDNTSGIGRMWNAASEKFGLFRKGTQCCASVRTSAL